MYTFFQNLSMGVFERRYASVQKTPLSKKNSSAHKNIAWGERVTPPYLKNVVIYMSAGKFKHPPYLHLRDPHPKLPMATHRKIIWFLEPMDGAPCKKHHFFG